MTATVAAFGIAVIVLVVGLLVGWHANRTYVANSDVNTTRGRISGYRKNRLRSGIIAIVFIVIAVLVFAAVVRH